MKPKHVIVIKSGGRVLLDGRSIGAITRNDLGTWDESPMVTWTADPPRGGGRMGKAFSSAADALDWLVGLAGEVAR